MKKHSIAAAISLLAAVAPLMAIGQSSYQDTDWWDDRWYVTPSIGYVWADGSRDADDGLQGSVAIGKPIARTLNLELRGSYEQLDAQRNGPGKFTNYGLGVDAQWFPMRQFGWNTWNRIQPYLLVGGGGIRDSVPGDNAWSGFVNAGIGAAMPLSDWGRLVLDARYRWDQNRGEINNASSFGDTVVSVGLQIPFGPKPIVTKAVPLAPVPMAAPAPAPAPVAQAPVVVPPPPPPPAPVSRTFNLSADGMFAFDSATLSDVGRSRVNEIIATARGAGFTATSIVITGHTDPLGTEAYNQTLSEKRAAAVREYMISQGVSASIIRAEGKGESQLRITEADCRSKGQAKTRAALIECLAPDRRVEAVVTGTQAAR